VQDYSFVKGEALITRVVAQVPKQWLVGYDAPAETLVVIAAAVLSLVAVWLAFTRAEGPERRALRLGGTLGLTVLAIAFVLALAGGDYYLSRYLLAAWLPLALVLAAGMGARRSGRLGVAVATAICALSVFVVVSVDARPELQRDDWRGVARAMGEPDPHGRAIVVSPINGSIPLRLYLRGATALPPAGASVGEIDAVAVAPRKAGGTRSAPPVPRVAPPPGFTEESRHQGRTFTVVRYRAKTPVAVTPGVVAPLALEPGTPDFLFQPGGG
jgi:hypothetical protein